MPLISERACRLEPRSRPWRRRRRRLRFGRSGERGAIGGVGVGRGRRLGRCWPAGTAAWAHAGMDVSSTAVQCDGCRGIRDMIRRRWTAAFVAVFCLQTLRSTMETEASLATRQMRRRSPWLAARRPSLVIESSSSLAVARRHCLRACIGNAMPSSGAGVQRDKCLGRKACPQPTHVPTFRRAMNQLMLAPSVLPGTTTVADVTPVGRSPAPGCWLRVLVLHSAHPTAISSPASLWPEALVAPDGE